MAKHKLEPTRVALVLGLLTASSAQASGFSVPEISVAGTAMSNALVANPDMLGAVPYNPSLAAFHPGTTVSGGINIVHAESNATPTGGSKVGFEGDDFVPIPNFQLTHQVSDNIVLGFGTNVPFGLSTEYPANAFPLLGANGPTESKVEIIDFVPSAAFKLGDNTSIGVGIDYYWVREVVFNTGLVENDGDGHDWGWNVSFAHVAGPLSIGASYHSESEVDIKGNTVVPSVPLSGIARTKLTVPWRAQIGARYEFTDAFALEFDLSRTGWSSFDVLSISHNNPAVPSNPIVSNNNWKDSNAYRLGGTFDVDGELQLRFGYTYDETGQPDSFFSPRTADADRHLFSIGAEKKLGDGWAVELSYMLVLFDDTNFASTTLPTPVPPPGTTETNGTAAVNGKYETTVHLFGLGVSKRF